MGNRLVDSLVILRFAHTYIQFFAVHSFDGLQDFQQKHVQKASYNYDSTFEHATLQCNLLVLNNSPATT